MKMKRTILILILFLFSLQAKSQQKGHLILGGGPEFVWGQGTWNNPSLLLYSLEAGISYNLLESLRLSGSLGGFRSVTAFFKDGSQAETTNGPMIKIGAGYVFRPNNKYISPTISISGGYRTAMPPKEDERRENKLEGVFIEAAVGADITIGGLKLNLAAKAALTQALRPAAGLSIHAFVP